MIRKPLGCFCILWILQALFQDIAVYNERSVFCKTEAAYKQQLSFPVLYVQSSSSFALRVWTWGIFVYQDGWWSWVRSAKNDWFSKECDKYSLSVADTLWIDNCIINECAVNTSSLATTDNPIVMCHNHCEFRSKLVVVPWNKYDENKTTTYQVDYYEKRDFWEIHDMLWDCVNTYHLTWNKHARAWCMHGERDRGATLYHLFLMGHLMLKEPYPWIGMGLWVVRMLLLLTVFKQLFK